MLREGFDWQIDMNKSPDQEKGDKWRQLSHIFDSETDLARSINELHSTLLTFPFLKTSSIKQIVWGFSFMGLFKDLSNSPGMKSHW